MVAIYALIDPVTSECRYIGKSRSLGDRYRDHVANYHKKCTRKNNWVASLVKAGFKPELVVLEEVPEREWQTHECFWIECFKFMGARLTNSTIGGEGDNFTPEIRAKLSAKAIEQWRDPARRPSRPRLTEEQCLRQSTAVRALLADPAKLAARIEQLKVASTDPLRLENLRKAAASLEVRAKHKQISAAWVTANPEKAAALGKLLQRPEVVAKCRAAQQSEEARKKMSDSAKLRWQRDHEKIVEAQNIGRRKKP